MSYSISEHTVFHQKLLHQRPMHLADVAVVCFFIQVRPSVAANGPGVQPSWRVCTSGVHDQLLQYKNSDGSM